VIFCCNRHLLGPQRTAINLSFYPSFDSARLTSVAKFSSNVSESRSLRGVTGNVVTNYASDRGVFSNPRMSLKEEKGRKPMGLLSEGL